ncbi:hypothetical protein DO021_15360 [Desulfobacter hydrogenophilus]|uniref:Co-chaperonin GroES n=1 Tax=Desulfobacter hydrogenophilus TaxID=2291 RepID=A0A328FDS1_9BACT|nr:co-chaperone GroES [Desulfobacter hydrogenophilus]QBH13592.1 co-chaperone GroES [Desulfobacter hydrogenophilus]RAM01187.1 hypothetical protein DO021_15360 [Desulfobacter hydrogenophilus]
MASTDVPLLNLSELRERYILRASIPGANAEDLDIRATAKSISISGERHIPEEEKTDGGIIIPDTAKEKPQEGRVVAVGPGEWNNDGDRMALEVKEGDRILFGKYAGTEIKIDGEEHIFMREDDILGILK